MSIIIVDCGFADGQTLPPSVCVSSRLVFFLDFIWIVILLYELKLQLKKKSGFFSFRIGVFYILILHCIINLIFFGAQGFYEAFLFDFTFRSLINMYLGLFYIRKLSKLEEKQIFSRIMYIISIILIAAIIGILIYGLIIGVKENFHGSTMGLLYFLCSLFSLCFLIFSSCNYQVRCKREFEKLNGHYKELIKGIDFKNISNCNETTFSFIEQNIENIIETDENTFNIWLITCFKFFTVFLDFMILIFYSFEQKKNESFFPFDLNVSFNENIVNLMGWGILIIQFFAPNIVLYRSFKSRKRKMESLKGSFSAENFPFINNLTLKGDLYGQPESEMSNSSGHESIIEEEKKV